MAVALTNLLLNENVVSTARTLYGLVDELTPYYQDLVKDIPPVWLLADFLTVFYSEEELHRHALYHLIAEPSANAEDLLRVWMRKKGMEEGAYGHDRDLEEMLGAAGVTDLSCIKVMSELYLKNLHPDMAIAVRAVAREAKLE